MDLMRKRLALTHDAITEAGKFERDVVAKINEEAYAHDATFDGPVGYSDTADRGYGYTLYRLTGTNTQPVVWVKRVFEALGRPLDHAQAVDTVTRIVDRLGSPDAGFLVERPVRGYRRKHYYLWMVNAAVIALWADADPGQWRCPKCGTVHRFRVLRVCTGSTCRTVLDERDLSENYFRQVYATPLGQAVPVRAEEHSGQVEGEERREIELRFRDEENPLNVLVCTPTMELGIDIGHLNAVTLRNVPPSPSNYAQRAGRAGRSGDAALITVFAGVGSSRGPHDQYFYRFPEKMIAGAIAAPRFRLDNRAILSAHIHALVLETMGLKGGARLPTKPRELLNIDGEHFPIYPDWRTSYQAGIDHHFGAIVAAVEAAFAREMERYDWLDRAFIERQVRDFLEMLDRAMDRWRDEYQRLDAEREAINRKLGQEGVDPSLNRRRVVIEAKLDAMRDGKRDWYLYRYLGGEGFLPGYAFPPQATALAFDDREDEMARPRHRPDRVRAGQLHLLPRPAVRGDPRPAPPAPGRRAGRPARDRARRRAGADLPHLPAGLRGAGGDPARRLRLRAEPARAPSLVGHAADGHVRPQPRPHHVRRGGAAAAGVRGHAPLPGRRRAARLPGRIGG
jgi:hypothetical protein